MDINWPMVGVAVAIMAHAVAMIFKTPKEYHGETERRIYDLEGRHNALAQDVAGTKGGILKAIEALTKEVDGTRLELRHLATAVNALAGRQNGRLR